MCQGDSSRGSKMMNQDFIPIVLRGVSRPDLSSEKPSLVAACICGARDPGRPLRRETRTGVVATETENWADRSEIFFFL